MTLVGPIILALAVNSAAAAPQPAPPAATAQQGAAPSPNSTTICRFQTGPLAGQIRDFAGVASVKPFAKGAPCTDGKDSVGVAVADRAGPSPSASGSAYHCRFTTGPRAGQTGEFQAPAQGVPRAGATCTDGKGSRGLFAR